MVKMARHMYASVGFVVLAARCLAIAAARLRSALPGTPGAPVDVVNNAFADPFLTIHALFGAAALLRLQLAVVGVAALLFSPSCIAISLLCWVPNLIVARIWIAVTRRQNHPASFSAG